MARVAVKVGTTTVWAQPENEAKIREALIKASKIKSTKAFNSAALKGGVSRKYPKFTEGMSTADYVRQYTMANARQTGYGFRIGSLLSGDDVKREEAWIKDFFQPLSDNPQFTPIEEAEACAS